MMMTISYFSQSNSKINYRQTEFSEECDWWTVVAEADIVNCSHFDLICDGQRQLVDRDGVVGWTVNWLSQPDIGVCGRHLLECYFVAGQHTVPRVHWRRLNAPSSQTSS